jgi:hypothetical protein
MKEIIRVGVLTSLIMLVGCESAADRKARSPECIAAKQKVTEFKWKVEENQQSTRNAIRSMQLQLENLRTEDRIAELRGEPPPNRKREAQIEMSIGALEVSQEVDPGLSTAVLNLMELDAQEACELPKRP